MSAGEQSEGFGAAGGRSIVYCLIPPELAPKLHDLLHGHFRDDPGVEVVVERRGRERRRGEERRSGEAVAPPPAGERRAIKAASGRRVGERRAPGTAAERVPELPRRARRHADRLTFVERVEPSTQETEDRDTARLVTRWQAGEREVYATLYTRYFGRVYGYFRLVLKETHEAEDAAQEVFAKALEALPRYERRRQPFRAWLFTIVRHEGLDRIAQRNHIELLEDIDARAEEAAGVDDQELPVLDWVTDPDLTILIERLPLLQRRILLLRYMFDLDYRQIGAILDRTPDNVRAQNYRALEFLRARLDSIGRRFRHGTRSSTVRGRRKANVLRARRYALDP